MIEEEVFNAINELFALKVKPDALLTASDRLTTSTINILSQMKIKVPAQVAVVGFTNSVNAGIFNPSLTAIVQSAFEMGKMATEMLIQIIESKRNITQFDKIIVDTQLIVRESSIKK